MDLIFRTDPNLFTSDVQYWQALANSYACVESGGQKKEVQAREERKREELQLRFRQLLIFFIKIEVPVPVPYSTGSKARSVFIKLQKYK